MAAKEKVDEHIRKQESLVIDTEASLKSERNTCKSEKQINSLANNEAAKAVLEEQQGILKKNRMNVKR